MLKKRAISPFQIGVIVTILIVSALIFSGTASKSKSVNENFGLNLNRTNIGSGMNNVTVGSINENTNIVSGGDEYAQTICNNGEYNDEYSEGCNDDSDSQINSGETFDT